MTERLREIETNWTNLDGAFSYPYPGRELYGRAARDIPYLLSVIKEQAEEIERLQSLVGGPHLCEAAKTVGCMCTGQCFNFKQSKIKTP